MAWTHRARLLLVVVLAPIVTGCDPFTMGFLTPVPVQAWVAERIEDKCLHMNDWRAPIMPPVRDGFPPPVCEDPPTDREVLRTMSGMCRGVPYFFEEFRDDIQITRERIVDKIDPPRFFPLVGPAQLHHCHWKCTIYFKQTIQSDYPFPVKLVKRRIEVIYVDKDHLHQYVGPDPEVQRQITREHTDY